jgi:hypothetical protein
MNTRKKLDETLKTKLKKITSELSDEALDILQQYIYVEQIERDSNYYDTMSHPLDKPLEGDKL